MSHSERNADSLRNEFVFKRREHVYVEFSIHQLDTVGLLPECAQTDALRAHPGFADIGVDQQAHNSSSPEHVELLALEVAVWKVWDAERRSSVALILETPAIPEAVRQQAYELLGGSEEQLALMVYRARGRHEAQPVSKSLKDPMESPREVKKLLEGLAHATEEDPLYKIREEAGLSQEEIFNAPLAAMEKLTNRLPILAEEMERAAVAPVEKQWATLWEHPGKRSPEPIKDAQVDLYDLLVPVLLGDEVLCALKAFRKLAKWKNQGRQPALAQLRSEPALLPVSEIVGDQVAKILNTFHANWRLNLDGEAVCSSVRRRRNPLETKPINDL